MASRKPLVLNAGQFQQLQAGDTLSVTSIAAVDLLAQTNNNAGSIVIGTPVYNTANDAVDKAKGDAAGTKDVIGLVFDTSIAASASGNIAVAGVMTATTGQWDTAFGTSGGLIKGTRYYLSAASAGNGTATAPSTVGQYVVQLGIAVSTTELLIAIGPVILL